MGQRRPERSPRDDVGRLRVQGDDQCQSVSGHECPNYLSRGTPWLSFPSERVSQRRAERNWRDTSWNELDVLADLGCRRCALVSRCRLVAASSALISVLLARQDQGSSQRRSSRSACCVSFDPRRTPGATASRPPACDGPRATGEPTPGGEPQRQIGVRGRHLDARGAGGGSRPGWFYAEVTVTGRSLSIRRLRTVPVPTDDERPEDDRTWRS